MQSKDLNELIPNVDNGRYFISPILGCTGACSYCYLDIKGYERPRKNNITSERCRFIALNNPNFVWGRNGTIISIGAWGDIFPKTNGDLTLASVQMIKDILSWGNPVQIMSKNKLSQEYIEDIASSVTYLDQLLYSTTITSIDSWKKIEPGVADPLERLATCRNFRGFGVKTNVLLKPFLPGVTDTEIFTIIDLLLEYSIDYCTIGIMYKTPEIIEKIQRNDFLYQNLKASYSELTHLDCNGEHILSTTSINSLLTYADLLRSKGIAAFLKSSCVNSNILFCKNPSGYYDRKDAFCIGCGNCARL